MDPHDWLPFFLAAHLFGDFVLQDQWMADRKASSHRACFVHILLYAAPFMLLIVHHGAPWGSVLLILAQHYMQDRYALHLKWMKFYGQTPPDKWPTGPLCVDQAMHVAWIALVCAPPLT